MISMLPGADGVVTGMMKKLIDKKGVASIEELREAAVDEAAGQVPQKVGHVGAGQLGEGDGDARPDAGQLDDRCE